MTAQAGDVYFAIARGEYLGENWINRWWYAQGGDEPDDQVSEVLVLAIRAAMGDLADALHEDWLCDYVEAYKWKDPASDYYNGGANFAGSISASQGCPSFLVISFRSSKGYPGQRYGYKRVSGIPELYLEGNDLATPNEYNNFATFLGSPISTTNGVLVPALIDTKTIPDINTGANPSASRNLFGQWTYKLGTQNSRKRGAGS